MSFLGTAVETGLGRLAMEESGFVKLSLQTATEVV